MTILKIVLFLILIFLCFFYACAHICLQSHEDDVINIAPATFLTIHMIPMYLVGKNLFLLFSLVLLIVFIFMIHYVGFVFVMNEFSSFTDFDYPLSFDIKNILSCLIPVLVLVIIKKMTGTSIIYYLLLLFGLIQGYIFIRVFPEILIEFRKENTKQCLFYIVPVLYHLILIFLFSM